MNHERATIAIVGGGLVGWSTAWHLAQGADRSQSIVVIDSADLAVSTTSTSAGVVHGGFGDNITRLVHARGEKFAKTLWQMADRAFDGALSYCAAQGVAHARGHRWRVATTAIEARELAHAKTFLKRLGLPFEDASERSDAKIVSPIQVAFQDEGERGAWVDIAAMHKSLKSSATSREGVSTRVDEVVHVNVGANGVSLLVASGQHVQAEVVVLANHLGVGKLIPTLREALVPIAEQWVQLRLAAPTTTPPGTVVSWNFGLESAVVVDAMHIRVWGGRYIRPMAGVGVTSAPKLAKLEQHLQRVTAEFCPSWTGDVEGGGAGLDIRPCDEVPIIGPMFGEQRILVAAGFMGMGCALGFFAGRALSALICKGSCPELPREVWPERLRSLSSE